MKTLSLIGCGNVGISFASLFCNNNHFKAEAVFDIDINNATTASSALNNCLICESLNQIPSSDIYLITTPDNHIEETFNQLTQTNSPKKTSLFIHCCGSKPAKILSNARYPANFLSIHPIRSFTRTETDSAFIKDIFCGIDGTSKAAELFKPILELYGAHPVDVNGDNKEIYHAASVFACNYLTALMEVSLLCFEKAGIERNTANNILRPLTDGTIKNIFNTSTTEALTGPIARGDSSVVAKQLEKLSGWNSQIAELYSSLGEICIELSHKKGAASKRELDNISQVLSSSKDKQQKKV